MPFFQSHNANHDFGDAGHKILAPSQSLICARHLGGDVWFATPRPSIHLFGGYFQFLGASQQRHKLFDHLPGESMAARKASGAQHRQTRTTIGIE